MHTLAHFSRDMALISLLLASAGLVGLAVVLAELDIGPHNP